MPLRGSLEGLRKKKEDMREDLRATKEDLLTFRPRPLQNVIHRRVHRLRNSFEKGALGERIQKLRKDLRKE